MPDFAVVQQATSLGNTCAFCSTHKNERGFVNLGRDELGYGRLHACAGCADQIGRAVGGTDPEQTGRLHGIVDELTETCERLREELESEQSNKVVPLAEVYNFLQERAARRPDEIPPAAHPKASA